MTTWGSKLGSDLKFGFLWIWIVVCVLIGEAKCLPDPVKCPQHPTEMAFYTGRSHGRFCQFRHYVPGRVDHNFWEDCNASHRDQPQPSTTGVGEGAHVPQTQRDSDPGTHGRSCSSVQGFKLPSIR